MDGSRGRTAWRAVPRFNRRKDSPAAHRRESAGCGDWTSGEPVLRHRHPCRYSRPPQAKARQDGGFHRCQSGVRGRQESGGIVGRSLGKIVATYTARESVDKYAYVADFDEIKENDFNLNIPRYVDTFEEEEEIDIRAVQDEIDELDTELAQVQEQMQGYLKELGL